MVDSFTESTPGAGFFEQVGGAIKGVLVGLVMVPVLSCCLMWNESDYLNTKKALEGGLALCVEVKSDSVESGNEGKLVLISGEAETKDELQDEAFSIAMNAMRLQRTVEMYQYHEDSKTSGKGKSKETTYTYSEKWSSKHQTDFKSKTRDKKYNNPPWPAFEEKSWEADSVSLGAFKLNKGQVSSFPVSQKINPGGASAAAVTPSATPTASATPAASLAPNTCPQCKEVLKSAQGLADHM